MKAALCTHYGPPEELELRDVPSPVAGKGQVVISVKACGVNFPDVLLIQDKYQFKPPLPFPPGGEVAGIVKEVGEGVTNVKPGDRVAVSTGSGGFAEEVGGRRAPLPDRCRTSVPFDVASSFIVTYGTSWHALKDRADLKPGENLVVLGAAGGVGLAAVEIGKALGARVIAGASSQEKVDLAKSRGADDGFVYPQTPLSRDQQKALSEDIKRLTGGQRRRRALRSGWRRLCRAGAARDELERPLPGDRLRGRKYPEGAAQSHAAERAARSSACSGAPPPRAIRAMHRNRCRRCSA